MLQGAIKLRQLGTGYYGTVSEYRLSNGKIVAVKSQPLRTQQGDVYTNAILEADAYTKLRPYDIAVNVESIIYDRFTIHFIMESMSCNLRTYVQNVSERNITYFINSMLEALSVLESLGINHYDIKPDNILVSGSERFKLVDFGLSRSSVRGLFSKNSIYTIWYRPPEMLSGYPLDQIPPYVSDVWAMGLTIHFFITGHNFTAVDSSEALLNKINRSSVGGTLQLSCASRPMDKYTLHQMLTLDPVKRPTGSKLLRLRGITNSIPTQVKIDRTGNVPVRCLSVIWSVNCIIGGRVAPYIIAIEILGRFLNLLGFHPPGYQNFVVAAHYLAYIYIDNPPVSIALLTDLYRKSFGQMNEVYVAISAIINKIEFKVYNPDLTEVIKRIPPYADWIGAYNYQHYLQPISAWFT